MPFQKGQSGNPKGKPKGATGLLKREAKIKAEGITPLDWMLKVLRDDTQDDERRDDMAKAAAPYVHPKLANTTLGGDPANPVRVTTKIEREIVDPQNPNR